ncbi:hypothetical protein Tco_0394136 [Tanacetum coccineum]
MWPADPLFSQDSKNSSDAGFKPSGEEEKKDVEDPGNKDSEVPSTQEPRVYQEKDDNVSSTNNVNTASNTINTMLFFMERLKRKLCLSTPGFAVSDFPNRVYNVEKELYEIHQAQSLLEAEGMMGFYQSRQYVTEILKKFGFTDIKIAMCALCKDSKSNPKINRKFTTRRLSTSLGCILISWTMQEADCQLLITQLKTVYITASIAWIGALDPKKFNYLDYGYNLMQTKIHIDNESTICIVKNPVFHLKTKHIEIRHHFIRDSNEKMLIQREGKGFSGRVTPLFQTMTVQAHEEMGEGENREKDTEIPQSSSPTEHIVDEVANEENVSTQSNDPPLSRFNTIGSGEDSLSLKELMDLCTKLSDRILDLETKKTVQAKEIDMFDKAFKRVNTFVNYKTELVEGSEKRAEDSTKRASTELEQEVSKKAKSQLLKEFDREDLRKIYGSWLKQSMRIPKPEEGHERVLCGDLKTMFEHHIEDEVWRRLHGKKVLLWRLYDSFNAAGVISYCCSVQELMLLWLQSSTAAERCYC